MSQRSFLSDLRVHRANQEQTEGFSLLEMVIAMAILLTIVLGVMASISNAAIAEMNASEALASQLLLSQTMEELKNNDFADLITFNGQSVSSGTNTALIRVSSLTTNLVRIQVDVTSNGFTDVANSSVLLVANPD